VSKRNGDAVTYLAGLLSQYCAFDFLFNSRAKHTLFLVPLPSLSVVLQVFRFSFGPT
jgi:hypothetical protein